MNTTAEANAASTYHDYDDRPYEEGMSLDELIAALTKVRDQRGGNMHVSLCGSTDCPAVQVIVSADAEVYITDRWKSESHCRNRKRLYMK
jgi:hypothetical protein